MILIGKTYGNLMVDVNALGSEKLRDRARRIVHIVTDLDYEEADKLLKKAHWNVKVAIVMQKAGLTYAKADRAAAQVRRPDPRSDRRRHRAPPQGPDRQRYLALNRDERAGSACHARRRAAPGRA